MNTLEQLKRAKEGEPKAVLVMDMPQSCASCYLMHDEPYYGTLCWVGNQDCNGEIKDATIIQDWCPLRKAIALVEPNGHLVYLGEEVE